MSRRTTLANIDPLQLNAKGGSNAAPGRCPKDGGGLPTKGRKSVAPVGALVSTSLAGLGPDRRSSVVGSKPSGPKQESRPILNKEYQSNCMRRIINYLSTHQFPQAISPKMLSSPTGKDFSCIVSFLFQQIDPAFKIQGKVEDEVPFFLKRLNYPFQISKSALFAVGTPHSWPGILAMLTWLIELLEYGEKAISNKSPSFDNKVEDFVEYLAEGYQTFMSGDDARCQVLDEQFADQKYVKHGEELDARCEDLQMANEQLQAELAQLKALADPVESAIERKRDQLMDKHKFEQLVDQDEALKKAGLRKLLEKKADIKAKEDQIAAAISDVQQLRQRVASQTVNKADVNRMIMERNKQSEVLASETAKCDEFECKAHEHEMKVVRCMTAVESLAAKYGQLVNRLRLIPASCKRAAGTNYELRINRQAASQADFCNLDLKGVVKPNLERLCEQYRTRASQLGHDLVSLREACAARKDTSKEKQEENSVLQAEIVKLESQLQAAKDAQEEKCRRLVVQAEGIKAQVDEFYSAASNRTEYMEDQLSRAQHSHEQTKRDCEAEMIKLEADLKQAIKLLIAHKEFVNSTIQRTMAEVRRAKIEIADAQQARLAEAGF